MTKWLTDRLARPEILIAPGAYDAHSAKLISRSHAEAVYCGGFATVASAYGLPDVGLFGLGEMSEIYRRIAPVVDKPLIVDGDTGYGGPLNVARTVRELGRIGVAAVHIEDQIDPKRCGHLDGKRVLSPRQAQLRVAAAVEAAAADGPAVIARTDALAPEGMDSVTERLGRFAEAGADAVFVDAPHTVAEIEKIRAAASVPLVFNAASTGVGPVLSAAELTDLGVDLVIHPLELLMATLHANRTMLADIVAGRAIHPPATFGETNELLGLPEHIAMDRKLGG